ncbi:MAG: hypothetical protein ACM37W_01540 [Actinomycetota bacterium]
MVLSNIEKVNGCKNGEADTNRVRYDVVDCRWDDKIAETVVASRKSLPLWQAFPLNHRQNEYFSSSRDNFQVPVVAILWVLLT